MSHIEIGSNGEFALLSNVNGIRPGMDKFLVGIVRKVLGDASN
jgi:hypothetical protein